MAQVNDTTTLKAGDSVFLCFCGRVDVRRQRATVKSVSPTGVTTVMSGSQSYIFGRDGRPRGEAKYSTVQKWIEKI